jgi:hypothetical protein
MIYCTSPFEFDPELSTCAANNKNRFHSKEEKFFIAV